MLFNYPWENNAAELITFYPKYYYNVVEMLAIIQAEGAILDEFMKNAQAVFDDCFIDTMDEQTVSDLEDFLNIHLYKQRTLEERKRLLKTFFVGHGKLSADLIKQTVSAYTGTDVEVYFLPISRTPGAAEYEPGDNRLYINYLRGTEEFFYLNDIDALLSRLVPAHLSYQSSLTYRFSVCTSPRRKKYIKDFDFAGTIPEISTLGLSGRTDAVVDSSSGLVYRSNYRVTFPFCGTTVCHDGV